MNGFSERFKSYSVVKLLSIINHSEDYQTEAVAAAKKEIESRSISKNELRLATEKLKKLQQKEPQDYYELINQFLEIFKPKNNKNGLINLKRVWFLIFLLFSYFIYRGSQYFKVIFSGFQEITILDLLFFLELFMLPIMAFFLLKKKPYVIQFVLVYFIIRTLYFFIDRINYVLYLIKINGEKTDFLLLYTDGIVLLLYSAILYFLWRPSLRNLYK